MAADCLRTPAAAERLARAWRALAASTLLLAGCGKSPAPVGIDEFLARHWSDPIAAQGDVPAGLTPVEASLDPARCGECHSTQWAQWQTSLHHRSMGPGIGWQLQLMDQAQGNRCLRCHAPLAEQKALVAMDRGWPARPAAAPPPHVPPQLAADGLVCAACHVRGHRRYGPPPLPDRPARPPAHGSFEPHAAFGDSRFCAHCHQFPADGPRVAGKLHEDTYAQWKSSAHAPERPCQSCHMPARSHTWRGIHDADITRQAIDVQLTLESAGPGRHLAVAQVRNVGAGHHFPTYMVAKVELHFARVRTDGTRVALGMQTIGWSVDTALREEQADTRIPAGQTRRFEQPFEAAPGAWRVELTIVVRPGEHYERTFRESLAHADRLPPAALPSLREALARIKAAEYELLTMHVMPRIAN